MENSPTATEENKPEPVDIILPWRMTFRIWFPFFCLYVLFLWFWRDGMAYIDGVLGFHNFFVNKLIDFSITQCFTMIFLKWSMESHLKPISEALYPQGKSDAVPETDRDQPLVAFDDASAHLPLSGILGIWWSFFWRYVSIAFGLSIFFRELGFPLFLEMEGRLAINPDVVPYFLACLIPDTLLSLKWAIEARWYVFVEATKLAPTEVVKAKAAE